MNIYQKQAVKITNNLLDNEVNLYGHKLNSFCKMRRFVRKNIMEYKPMTVKIDE